MDGPFVHSTAPETILLIFSIFCTNFIYIELHYVVREVTVFMEFLAKYKKAFTALLVGSIMAIMIGAVLLVVAYVVINAIVGSTGTISNAMLNASLQSNIVNITSALNIAGIGLIVAGIAGIVYMLIGLGGVGGKR